MKLATLIVALFALPSAAADAENPRAWTTRDSMLVRYFEVTDACGASYFPIVSRIEPARPMLVSPDSRYFVTVSTEPDLTGNALVSSLRIYSRDAVLAAVRSHQPARPLRELTRTNAANTNAAPICAVEWSENSQHLRFLSPAPSTTDVAAERNRSPRLAIHVLEISNGRVATLNPGPHAAGTGLGIVSSQILAWSPKAVLYRSFELGLSPPVTSSDDSSVFSVLTFSSLSAMVSHERTVVSNESPLVFYLNGRRREPPMANIDTAAFSPNGRQLIAADRERFVLTDVASERSTEIAQRTPGAASVSAVWSPDGQGAVLIGAWSDQAPRPAAGLALTYFDATQGTVSPLGNISNTAGARVRWVDSATIEAYTAEGYTMVGSEPARHTFHRASGRWHSVPTPASLWSRLGDAERPAGESVTIQFANGLRIALAEDYQSPPRLTASSGANVIELIGSSPELAGVAIAPSRDISFRGADGANLHAVLTLPQTPSSTPFPLVIQWQPGLARNVFRPDGAIETGYATQALAARGIAVLNLPLPTVARFPTTAEEFRSFRRIVNTPAELDAFISDADAAIDAAKEVTNIDVSRIAMLGFSRQGLPVSYYATHPGRYSLRAGIAFDSFDFSFSSQNLFETAKDSSYGQIFADGANFWQNREAWLRLSPELNVDHSNAALLFVSAGAELHTVFAGIIHLGAYRAVRRPVEAINFPLGQHPFTRPKEVLASMNLTVDWMTFWLQGAEDPDPAKAEQYTRWRQLHADWERQEAWETAGHPVGSAPAADFQAPR